MIQIENISEIKNHMAEKCLRIYEQHRPSIHPYGDVTKFRTPNQICFEIMRLRLGVEEAQMGYVGNMVPQKD